MKIVCAQCGGDAEIPVWDWGSARFELGTCPYCNGTGEIEINMTNIHVALQKAHNAAQTGRAMVRPAAQSGNDTARQLCALFNQILDAQALVFEEWERDAETAQETERA